MRIANESRVEWNLANQILNVYLKPAYHKLLSWSGKSIASYRDVSEKRWTITPPETQCVIPAIYRPQDLARITSAWDGPSIKHEVELLLGGTREHAATIAYQLKDVDVVDGHLYCGRWKDKLLPKKARLLGRAPSQRASHGTLACTYSGNHYFGHWLLDDLTLYMAAQEIGNPFGLERQLYLHEPGYRQLLDISCKTIADMHFDELVILQDFGQNSYKRKRYYALRTRLRNHAAVPGRRRVLLRRGNTGVSRAIVNGDEFESYLASVGFSIVDPEHLTASEIVKQTIGAEIVIGVEGSQLLHAPLTMAEGGVLCCVQPPFRFNSSNRGFTDCLGMYFATIVGHPAEGGFRVDIEDLKWVIDQMDTVLYLGFRSTRMGRQDRAS